MRNRAILAAAGIALALLAATIVTYTWRLERERDRAELAAAKSQQVADFLVKLFREADPWKAPGSTRSAADLLEQGLRDIDRLADQPALQADLLHVMGAAYTSLGAFDSSVPILERSLALYRADSASDPRSVTIVLNDLGHALRVAGQLTRAEAILREALAMNVRLHGEQHTNVAQILDLLGTLLHDQDRAAEAVQVLRRALAIKETLGETGDTWTADILNNLAISLDSDGHFEEAAATHQRALTLNRKLIGPQHPDLATGIYNLGLVLERLGRYTAAEQNHREALVMRRAVLGESHWQVAQSETALAMIQARRGHFDEAIALAEHAVAMSRRSPGMRHAEFAARSRHLANVRLDFGDYRGAEFAAREAVAAFDGRRSEYGAMLAWAEAHLALALLRQARVTEARATLQPAFDLRDGVNIRVALLLQLVMAQVLTAERAYPQAERLFTQTLSELERLNGADNEKMAGPHLEAARHHLLAGRPDRAVAHARRAFDLSRKVLGEQNWATGEAAGVLAEALRATGKAEEAKALFQLARTALQGTFGDADPRVRRLASLQALGG